MTVRLRHWALGILVTGAIVGGLLRRRISGAIDYVASTPPWAVGICACAPDSVFELVREDGVTLAAYGYRAPARPPRGRVVLVHGNTGYGSMLPMYRVLARQLADRGFDVLSIDFAGFGASGDPFAAYPRLPDDSFPPVWFSSLDVTTALEHRGWFGDPASPLTLLGHSAGATPALDVGKSDARVSHIVLLGPPRRVEERSKLPHTQDAFWDRANRTRRAVVGTPFPHWFTQEFWARYRLWRGLAAQAPDLQSRTHKPVLFIDGERESAEDREYLKNYVAELSPPVGYYTVGDADHYLNVKRVLSLCLYDRQVMREVVAVVVGWMTEGRSAE